MNMQSTRRTLTALFDERTEAMRAVDALVAAGISRSAVRVSPETDTTSVRTPTTSYDTSRDEKGFWATLGDIFMPDEDRYTYAEAVHRGSIMVSVSVDGSQADRAEDILEQHGAVNVDEREESWRKEGWAGYSATAAAAPSASSTRTGASSGGTAAAGLGRRDMADGDQVISEVEEQLQVGKRQVNTGRVKVRSYVVETPVSEQVNLHSETVRVERRPVDRPMGATEDAFRERTIEAVATSEEAVIAKEARVVGEVVVRKEASDRTETVSDKVRSTKVEVEDDGITTATPVSDTTRRPV